MQSELSLSDDFPLNQLAKSETNSSKVEYTQESLISPRQRMNGLEKCSVCSTMLKDSKEGDVVRLDTCNDYYHVDCLCNYIKEQLNVTEFIISCAKEGCTGTIELKKLQKIMTRQEFTSLKKLHDKWSRHILTNIVEFPDPESKFWFVKQVFVLRHECANCMEAWCLACRVPYHEGMSCRKQSSLQLSARKNVYLPPTNVYFINKLE